MTSPKPAHDLGQLILTLRGQRVILDSHLAALYEVPTGALNQAVKRNADRFPAEFAFQLEAKELAILKSQTVISSSHGGRRFLPYVFTEHGVLMAANVLNSPRAVAVSVALVKAFVRLREVLADNQVMAKRLAEVEKTLVTHDAALRDIYQRIKPLLLPPPDPPRKKIGF
jgi:phage regulator Rha-like protein